jgi:hypothetical protein
VFAAKHAPDVRKKQQAKASTYLKAYVFLSKAAPIANFIHEINSDSLQSRAKGNAEPLPQGFSLQICMAKPSLSSHSNG